MPTRPCWVEVSTGALEENYRVLRGIAGPDAECLAIVKANAYGHGLAICAPAAVRAGAKWLGVTSVEEGVEARAVCPGARILVIGGVFPGQGNALIAHNLTPLAWDARHFDELERAASAASIGPGSLPVHLEVDTGMSRQGASLDDLPAILSRFNDQLPLRLEAITTHLYASDEAGGVTTAQQLARLEAALAKIRDLRASAPRLLSVGATAALLGSDLERLSALARRSKMQLMLRLGLALYGVAPRFTPQFAAGDEPGALIEARSRLQPVLAWKTRVVSVRDIPAGTEVGYNGTFVAVEAMRIALLAAGYADGLDRRLGNRFRLLVAGERAPLIGRISMDQCVVDVTEIPGVQPGDEVVILGTQGDGSITAFDQADACGTIPWEVFTRIAPRVPRIAV
ncbi:MAG TPA: alanine racemase [Terracidiphilus sp.]|nr:alanine racemase [Terracidiphilus sp.]